jgi:hypothetical protein
MRSELWKHMHEEHGLSLLESELNDIETIVYAELRKLRDEIRADQYESADVNIWYSDGCKHAADKIDKLLEGRE